MIIAGGIFGKFTIFWTEIPPSLRLHQKPSQFLNCSGLEGLVSYKPVSLKKNVYYHCITVSVVHIKQTCSPDIYTSIYGIFNGLFFGGGAVLGNVIGGFVLMATDVRTLCFWTSIAAFVWTFFMSVFLAVESCTFGNSWRTMQEFHWKLFFYKFVIWFAHLCL